MIAVYDANHFAPLELYHAYKIIFICSLIDGEPTPSNETLAVDFFDRNNFPILSTSRTNERMLQEVFAHVENWKRPAAFD